LAAAPAAVAEDKDAEIMIAPLRRAHFRIWLALAVALYAIFVAGLLARRPTTPPNPGLHWEQYR
jgi:hypothetical protein